MTPISVRLALDTLIRVHARYVIINFMNYFTGNRILHYIIKIKHIQIMHY